MPLSHAITFRVRYNECDPMGVAHHAAYPVWFEMGRTELLRHGGQDELDAAQVRLTYRDLESRGIFLAVTSLNIRYKRPARYDDVLVLHTSVVNTGHVKIDHAYELVRDAIILATGTTTLACLDRDGRPRALPADLAAL